MWCSLSVCLCHCVTAGLPIVSVYWPTAIYITDSQSLSSPSWFVSIQKTSTALHLGDKFNSTKSTEQLRRRQFHCGCCVIMFSFGIISLVVMLILRARSSLVHCADVPDQDDAEFALSAYCKSMCQWGRGGNLCNCHAAYFAGKRSSPPLSSDGGGQAWVAPGSSTGVGRPSTDDHNDIWIALSPERHPLTKLPPAAGGRDGDSEIAEDDVERRWWTATEELRRHMRSATSNSVSRWPWILISYLSLNDYTYITIYTNCRW